MWTTIRSFLQTSTAKYLPEPHGGLLNGIVWGLRAQLSTDFYNDLINTGTIHVVAASGFNITLVARTLLDGCSLFFSKRLSVLLSFMGIWAYAIISGASAAVVRAAVMGSLAYLAIGFGRKYHPGWSLFLAGISMLLYDYSYIEDVGFWLSILATAGVLWLTPSETEGVSGIEKDLVKYGLQNKVEAIHPHGRQEKRFLGLYRLGLALKNDLITSVAAQVATLPILWFVFGSVSLTAPLVNMITLWLVPIIMIGGVFKVFLGMFSGFLQKVSGIVVFIWLDLFVRLIAWSSEWVSWSVLRSDYDGFLDVVMLIVWVVLVVWLRRKVTCDKQ